VKALAAFLIILVLAAAGAYFLLGRGPSKPPDASKAAVAPTREPGAAPAPRDTPALTPPSALAPAPTRKAAPKKTTSEPAEPTGAPAAPTTATLTLDSDVNGASVFIDRQYVGTTPLTVDKIAPGTKQLKLTADGYEGIERTVDLMAGANPVTMKFREVRLNKRTQVVHKHAMGSCEGALVATVDGLAYETPNKGDAFTMSYAQIETFAVDYLQKNLRVKQKGGKTWNFTDKNDNADTLFVFHRDVEAARKKLAEGYAPVK
jgi:hypothetical protein